MNLDIQQTLVNISNQLLDLRNEADTIYTNHAQSKTTYDNLKKYEPFILAEEACKKEGAENKRKREAMSTETYKNHLLALDHARNEYNLGQGKVNALELKLSALQTVSKIMLAELKLNPLGE